MKFNRPGVKTLEREIIIRFLTPSMLKFFTGSYKEKKAMKKIFPACFLTPSMLKFFTDSYKEETAMKKIFLVSILFLIPVYGFCVYWGNDIPLAYLPSTNPTTPSNPGDDPDTKSLSPTATMDELTIRGAAYFLKSSSGFTLFLQAYEQNSGDIVGLKPLLTEAAANLEKSTAIYSTLKEIASGTPYNPAVLYRLSAFDYESFRKEKGLYPDVFKKVSALLKSGNITGTFDVIHTRGTLLLNRMDAVMKELNSGLIPDVWDLWQISQDYTYLTLFGQYESMVFRAALD